MFHSSTPMSFFLDALLGFLYQFAFLTCGTALVPACRISVSQTFVVYCRVNMIHKCRSEGFFLGIGSKWLPNSE